MLKLKKMIYSSAKFGGIYPRIGHMCRASDRVWEKKLNCAGFWKQIVQGIT